MRKAVVALGMSFALGTGSLALLGGVLGSYAEAVALGLAGIGLVAISQTLGWRRTAGAEAPEPGQVGR
jgi:hypothetical protein